MRLIKRAYWSILQRKTRTLGYTAVFFIVGNLIFGSMLIQRAGKEATQAVKNQVGTEVTLQVNMEKVFKQSSQGDRPILNQTPILSSSDAIQLATFSGVKTVNYITSNTAMGKNIKPIHMKGYSEERMDALTPEMVEGKKIPEFQLYGVLDSSLLKNFKMGIERLVDGTGINKSQEGKNTVFLEQSLAELNDLHVGETILLAPLKGNQSYSFKIVGIYKTSEEKNTSLGNVSFLQPQNKLYVPYTAVSLFREAEQSGLSIERAIYTLKSHVDLDEFKLQAIKQMDMNTFSLDANQDLYQSLVKPYKNIVSGSTLFLWVLIGLGVILVFLLALLNVKDRKQELEILLALGERKDYVFGQMIFEITIIAIIAFMVSIPTAPWLANQAATYLVGSELVAEDVLIFGNSETSLVTVSLHLQEMVKLIVIGTGIAVVGAMIPSWRSLAVKPETILLESD